MGVRSSQEEENGVTYNLRGDDRGPVFDSAWALASRWLIKAGKKRGKITSLLRRACPERSEMGLRVEVVRKK